ncbi:MAG: SGNH/GDSL hydrolase family protein, partial [Solirubrobacterales bacterium]
VEKFKLTQFAPSLALPGCPPANSFSRNSAAVRSGSFSNFGSSAVQNLSPATRPDPACVAGETPISCEIRQIQPRYTIVMTGTNDFGVDRDLSGKAGTFTAPRMGIIAAQIRQAGSVPVFSTLPPIYTTSTPGIDEWGDVKKANQKIYEASRKLKVPLINLWSALTEPQMIDHGLLADGVHLSVLGGINSPDIFRNSVNLSDEALRYGANRRNLIWIQTLAALDEVAESG